MLFFTKEDEKIGPFYIKTDCFTNSFISELDNEIRYDADAEIIMGGRKNSNLNEFSQKDGKFDAWSSLKQHLTSKKFLENLQDVYSSDLEYWRSDFNFNSSNIKVDIDFSEAGDGYWREQHRDHDQRLWSFIIFFNDKTWSGGDLVIHSDKNVAYHKRTFFNKRLPILKKLESKKNLGVFWLSSPDSYHSVTLQRDTLTKRRFVYGSLTINDEVVFKRKFRDNWSAFHLVSDIFDETRTFISTSISYIRRGLWRG